MNTDLPAGKACKWVINLAAGTLFEAVDPACKWMNVPVASGV